MTSTSSRFGRRAIAAFSAILMTSLAVLAGPSAAFAAPSAPAATIIDLTNQTRASVGAPAIVNSDALQAIAQTWAEKLANENFFEHNGNLSTQLPGGWSAFGENIAMGTNVSPEKFHDMWVNSPGHYKNLTNPAFNVMGVGYTTAANGTVYGVEVFGRYDDIASVTTPAPAPAPAPAEPVAPQPAAPQAGTEADAAPDAATAVPDASSPDAGAPVAEAPAPAAAAATPPAKDTSTVAAPEKQVAVTSTRPAPPAGLAITGTDSRIVAAWAGCGILALISGIAFIRYRRSA